MYPKGFCKCLSCGGLFEPDARQRARQRRCAKTECRRASKQASQRKWQAKPENHDYFKGPQQVRRTQVWRAAHPGYWQRKRSKGGSALQEMMSAQVAAPEKDPSPDGALALQDASNPQLALMVGFIAHVTGTALQEDIVAISQRFISHGRAVLGKSALWPSYDNQTHPPPRAAPPGAAAV